MLGIFSFLLLSGKTNNVVKDGLNQRSPARSGKVKPNNHIAQGSALGRHYTTHLHSPCKGKSIIIKLLPLQGAPMIIPLRLPWAMRSLGFQPVHYWLHLSNSSKLDCIRFAR